MATSQQVEKENEMMEHLEMTKHEYEKKKKSRGRRRRRGMKRTAADMNDKTNVDQSNTESKPATPNPKPRKRRRILSDAAKSKQEMDDSDQEDDDILDIENQENRPRNHSENGSHSRSNSARAPLRGTTRQNQPEDHSADSHPAEHRAIQDRAPRSTESIENKENEGTESKQIEDDRLLEVTLSPPKTHNYFDIGSPRVIRYMNEPDTLPHYPHCNPLHDSDRWTISNRHKDAPKYHPKFERIVIGTYFLFFRFASFPFCRFWSFRDLRHFHFVDIPIYDLTVNL